MKNIIQQMRIWLEQKTKMRQLKCELLTNYNRKLKHAVFVGLKKNIKLQEKLRIFQHARTLKFKKEMYDSLRYCVRKQQILRYALLETLQKRGMKRAHMVLNTWKQRTIDSINLKCLIERNIKLTIFRRVLRQVGKV